MSSGNPSKIHKRIPASIVGGAPGEVSLAEKVQFHEALLNDMLTFVGILEPNGDIIFINNTPLVVGGLNLEDLRGMKFYDAAWWTHSDEVRELVKHDVELCAAGRNMVHDVQIRTADGSLMWIEYSMHPVRDDRGEVTYLIPEGRDITARIQAEEKRRASEEQNRAIIAAMPDLMFRQRRDGTFLDYRLGTDGNLGVDPDQIIGNNIADMGFAPEFVEQTMAAIEQTLHTEESQVFEYEMIIPGVGPREYEARLVACGEDEVLSFIRDITDRKQHEQEKLELERRVQHSQKLESLGVLAGGIAHDFNNILVGILGNADLARQDLTADSPALASVKAIEQAARRAAELAGQMLAYSGRGHFVIEPVQLNTLLRESAELLKASTSRKAVLEYNLASDLPTFEGDITQIRQVVMNLIINASEAIGDRRGTITLTTKYRKLGPADLNSYGEDMTSNLGQPLREGGYVVMRVSDNGCGMDDETRTRLFEPFFSTKFTGRGLGMSAVLGITQGHRGGIKVSSEPGKGSTFEVILPANEPGVGEASAGGSEAEDDLGASPVATVMVVDDEDMVRDVSERMLQHLGFNVLVATGGRAALKIFAARADEIACVFLDQTMGDMGGHEVLPELRRIRPDIPVVLCSGFSENEVAKSFIGAAPSGFIQKPFTLDELRSMIRRFVKPQDR